MSRLCVFCAQSGLTREHVIPQWLATVLPQQAAWRGQDQRIVLPLAGNPISTLDLPHREMQQPFTQTTVRAVCSNCNSGWMNQLEEAVRVPLAALVRGDRHHLTPEQALALSTWAVKTSLMVQLTGTETSPALKPLYRTFHTDRQPPPNTLVWAATIDGDSWALRSEAVSILVGDPDHPYDAADSPNTLAVTLGLGSLLLQTVMTTLPTLSTPPLAQIMHDEVIALWPEPTTSHWPHPHPLSDQGAWLVAHSLSFWLSI